MSLQLAFILIIGAINTIALLLMFFEIRHNEQAEDELKYVDTTMRDAFDLDCPIGKK